MRIIIKNNYVMIRFIYVVFVLLLISCSTDKKEAEPVVVDFSEESSLFASEVLSVSYLKLETVDSCLLGGCNQCTSVGGHYILLDKVMTRSLYAFNQDGSFVTQIGSTGNGPGEYINPFKYSVNEHDNTLSVVDIEQQKMIVYSLDDFHFVSEKKMPFHSDDMEQLPDGNYVWYNKLVSDKFDSYAFITDKEFNVKKSFLPIEFSSGYALGANRKLYKCGDEVSLYTPFNPALLESPYVAYYNVYENDQSLCIPYYVDKTLYFGFYDKRKNVSYSFSQSRLQSELQVGAFSSPIGITQDGSFVSLLRPGLLLQLQEEGYEINGELQQLLKESVEDDNPILLIFSLKK